MQEGSSKLKVCWGLKSVVIIPNSKFFIIVLNVSNHS